MALPKDSEFLGLFNYHLIQMYQSGVLEFINHDFLHQRKPQGANWGYGEDASALGYENLFFPSAILSIGVVAALFITVAEKISSRGIVLLYSGINITTLFLLLFCFCQQF